MSRTIQTDHVVDIKTDHVAVIKTDREGLGDCVVVIRTDHEVKFLRTDCED